MSNTSKPAHQRIAMAILTSGADLRPKEGAFCGQVAFDANPLTPKQQNWLNLLQERHLSGERA